MTTLSKPLPPSPPLSLVPAAAAAAAAVAAVAATALPMPMPLLRPRQWQKRKQYCWGGEEQAEGGRERCSRRRSSKSRDGPWRMDM